MNSQKGVSLTIAFLVMTVMLATVLGFSTMVFNQIKMLDDIENAVSSFYAAESGIEKTLYFDRKQIKKNDNATRGLCSICGKCKNCSSCKLSPLSANGCNFITCSDCRVTYKSVFDGRSYDVSATVTPGAFFESSVTGMYGDSTTNASVTSDAISATPEQK